MVITKKNVKVKESRREALNMGLHICKSNLNAQNAELKLNKSTKSVTEFEITIPVIV